MVDTVLMSAIQSSSAVPPSIMDSVKSETAWRQLSRLTELRSLTPSSRLWSSIRIAEK